MVGRGRRPRAALRRRRAVARAADAPSLRISPSITLATLICPMSYNPYYSTVIQKRDTSNPTVDYNYDFGLSALG